MNAVEKLKYKGYKIKIFYDEDAQNPYQDWDQCSDVTFWLRNYNLNSTGSGQMDFDGPDAVVDAFSRGKIVYYQWIRAYIHSVITVSLGSGYPFNDPWDSGLAGVVYVTKEKATAEFPRYGGRDLWLACERLAKTEIETLDMYLTGQVYGYVVKHKGVEVDSRWSCYGLEYCIQEAKSAVDMDIKHQARSHEQVLDEWFGFIPQEGDCYEI